MIKRWCIRYGSLLLLTTWMAQPAITQASAGTGKASLQAAYVLHETRRRHANGGIPVVVETSMQGEMHRGNVYAILAHPYGKVTETLRHPRNWCDILPLHMNIKACTAQSLRSNTRLTLYAGRKSYQPPGIARAMHYSYRVHTLDKEYFSASLATDKADSDSPPVSLEAMPAGQGQTFLHVRYAWRTSLWQRVATDGYFATVGSHKVGFSSAGTDQHGAPALVGGIHGAVERNALRYYLALDAYFSTAHAPEAGRFDQRLSHWFDHTERYPAQLHEMEKTEYLRAKRKERSQQLKLQQRLDERG